MKLFFPFSLLHFVYLHCETTRVLKVTARSRWNPWLLDQLLPCFRKFYISLKCYLRFSVFWIKLTFKKKKKGKYSFSPNLWKWHWVQTVLSASLPLVIILYNTQAIIFFNLWCIEELAQAPNTRNTFVMSSGDPQYIWSCFLAFMPSLFDCMKMVLKKRKWTKETLSFS